MILDDHEIEDNWSQDRIKEPKGHQLFNIAIGAYLSYQWSHGPRTWGRLLYYTFECGALSVLRHRYAHAALQGRFRRACRQPPPRPAEHRSSASPGSSIACCAGWSASRRSAADAPKFIVSVERLRTQRRWTSGSPRRRRERQDRSLHDQCRAAGGERQLAGVSDHAPGDPRMHRQERRSRTSCSCRATFIAPTSPRSSFDGPAAAKKLKAFNVTSSAFYWPFPFAVGDPNNYVHDSTQEGAERSVPGRWQERRCTTAPRASRRRTISAASMSTRRRTGSLCAITIATAR